MSWQGCLSSACRGRKPAAAHLNIHGKKPIWVSVSLAFTEMAALKAKAMGTIILLSGWAVDWRGADVDPHIPIVSFKWPEDWAVKIIFAVRTVGTSVDSAPATATWSGHCRRSMRKFLQEATEIPDWLHGLPTLPLAGPEERQGTLPTPLG